MEVKSPYLEELLSLLMTVGTQNGTAGPVAMVISLLLQESEERAVKKEVDSNKWAPQFYFPLKSCKKHSYLMGQNDNTRLTVTKKQKTVHCLWSCTCKLLLDLVWKGLIGFAAFHLLYRFICCGNHRIFSMLLSFQPCQWYILRGCSLSHTKSGPRSASRWSSTPEYWLSRYNCKSNGTSVWYYCITTTVINHFYHTIVMD